MSPIRAFLSLALLAIVSRSGGLASQQQECEVDTDGSCVTDNECVDNHEKCNHWMTLGKETMYSCNANAFLIDVVDATCCVNDNNY